ncbi:hypothetical protein B0H63DRAFT_527654 [Podospora didyma]|uniref:Uncharacterized protein n=1 Tax=Podospora didyma TaxID=330526 RepID=A0AAE0K4B7_9PEZI|nr:hypothetical protein B0H63DRAFT_527654 [Podospora didyma]
MNLGETDFGVDDLAELATQLAPYKCGMVRDYQSTVNAADQRVFTMELAYFNSPETGIYCAIDGAVWDLTCELREDELMGLEVHDAHEDRAKTARSHPNLKIGRIVLEREVEQLQPDEIVLHDDVYRVHEQVTALYMSLAFRHYDRRLDLVLVETPENSSLTTNNLSASTGRPDLYTSLAKFRGQDATPILTERPAAEEGEEGDENSEAKGSEDVEALLELIEMPHLICAIVRVTL